MRKIIVGEMVSLDGVMEGPGPTDNFVRAGWTMPYFSDDIGSAITENMMKSDAMLLGRKTYDSFSSFANESGGMADFLNNVPKYVVSTTLKSADWKNSTLISGNVVEEITKLKQQSGKDIIMNGSCTLIQTLIQHNLVDEYSLLVFPIVVGTGKHLFGEGSNVKLKLITAKALSAGVIQLDYEVEK